MRQFTKILTLAFAILLFITPFTHGQSVLDPSDPIVNYNPSSPPTEPAWGQIGKWVRTPRLGWNTSSWKCYIYKGIPFRLKFPKTYNPTAVDGKKYPMMAFFHGYGEAGPNTDNEYQLYHGAEFFQASVDNGSFDGYVICMQSIGYWGTNHYDILRELIDIMAAENKVDPFKVSVNGLSSGGQACWQMIDAYPQYISAALPMSWTSFSYGDATMVNKLKFSPMWNFQGGQDNFPSAGTSQGVRDAFLAAGANYRYTEYPLLGHGTWDSAWAEPDFWNFQKRAYASNPWPLFGRTEFCPGDPISTTIGVAPGFDAYEWRKDGAVVQTGTSNTLAVTALGTYDVRVQRGSVWSDWSHTPVVIKTKGPTVAPSISVSGLASKVLPALDGSTTVKLEVPAGFLSYDWQKVGNATSLGNTRFFVAPGAGDYHVQVTEQWGCGGAFSSAFTVVNANGPNKPDPAVNLIATTMSKTSIRLDWSDNPTPQFNETNFEIYYGTQPGGPYKLAAITAQDIRTYTLTGLAPNTRYFFRVRAVNNTAAATPSNEVNGTTQMDTQAPTAPTNLVITTSSRTSITIKWTASTDDVGVVRYDIYVNGLKSFATTSTQFTVSGLQTPNNYAFTVRAVDGAGNVSVPSNQVTGQPLLKGLDYKYYNLGGPSVLPDYNSLVPNATGLVPNITTAPATQSENYGFLYEGYINIPVTGQYTFNTYSDDGSRMYLGSLNGQGSPYTYAVSPTLIVDNDGGHGAMNVYSSPITLTAGTYPFAVAYFNGVGSGVITISWQTPQTGGNFTLIPDSVFVDKPVVNGQAPVKPSNLVATTVSYKRIDLSWTDNSNNETGFEIWRSTTPVSNFAMVGLVAAGVNSYKDSSLAANTQYYYKVRAVNQYGESDFDRQGQGVDYEYYEKSNLTEIPNFNPLTPNETGHVSNFGLGMQNRADNFALKFTGTLNIPATGIYTFYLNSDDGSKLYIDGLSQNKLIVNNDGLHGPQERAGSKNLSAGKHTIYVMYFDGTGPETLEVKMAGTGIPKQTIPEAYLGIGFVSATTLAAPATPAQPTNLVASAISRSAITVTWNDNATNETKYELYRSGNGTPFLLYATLAPNTTQFTDSGLFPNAVFSYRVRAAGVNNSAYSNTDTAKTWNTAPVITQLPASRTAHDGVITTIPISATDGDGDALTFSGQNLPAFASLVDNGNRTATLTLNAPASGSYNNIRINVADANGGSDFTQFNLTVNNNYDPAITAITNYTLNENDNLNIPLSATDANGDNISWAVTNLPNAFTLNSSGNGTSATLSLNPGFGASGSYTVYVTASDGAGGYSTRQFNLTVNDKDPNTKVYVRIKQDAEVGTPWNSVTSGTSTGFNDQYGNATTFGLNFPDGFSTGNAGSTTGNNSGIYPDAVLRNYYVFGTLWYPVTANAVLTGLDPARKYDLTLLGSSTWDVSPDNGSTNYTVNGQTLSLNVQNNTQNTVGFNNISPAPDGTITIAMAKGTGATAGFLNSIVLSTLYDDGTVPAAPLSLVAQALPGQVKLSWQGQAYNASGYEIYRATSPAGPFTQVGTAYGPDVSTYLDKTVLGQTWYYYKIRTVSLANLTSAFTDVVSIQAANRVPVISSISNVTLRNDQSLNVNVTATDDVNDQVTLTATGLPQFASFTDNGNGTGTVSIQPLASSPGVYRNVIITATDNSGASSSESFDITVLDKDLVSLYLNFTSGPTEGKPWNNLSGWPAAGTVYNNLKDDRDSTWTSVSVNLQDGFSGNGAFGMRPGNDKQIYPVTVVRTGLYESSTTTKNIVVSGLSASRKYNFVFFNSHDDGTSGTTDFTINGVTVSLDATYNIDRTVQINGVTPDGSGQVIIGVTKSAGSDAAYLNAMVIQSYVSATVPFVGPAELRVVAAKRNSITLQWQDRSDNETNFDIYRTTAGGSYQNIATVGANITSYVDSDPALVANKSYYYIVRARKATAPTTSAYSNVAVGYTYGYSIYVNFSNYALEGQPWNNTATPPQVGHVWNNLRDDAGAPTSVGMVEMGTWAGMVNGGVSTGNNSGIFPDNVMSENYGLFQGQRASIKLTGMNLTMKYDLSFFGSIQSGGDQNTAYTVNGRTVLLNNSWNKGGTVTLYGVEPDQNGEILITVTPGTPTAQLGLLGAMIINGYKPEGNTIPAPPARSTVSPEIVQGNRPASIIPDEINVTAYPNPFGQYFTLTVSTARPGKLDILVYDVNGRLVYQTRYGNLNSGTNRIRVQPDKPLLPGVYMVKAVLGDRTGSRLIKVVKQ